MKREINIVWGFFLVLCVGLCAGAYVEVNKADIQSAYACGLHQGEWTDEGCSLKVTQKEED